MLLMCFIVMIKEIIIREVESNPNQPQAHTKCLSHLCWFYRKSKREPAWSKEVLERWRRKRRVEQVQDEGRKDGNREYLWSKQTSLLICSSCTKVYLSRVCVRPLHENILLTWNNEDFSSVSSKNTILWIYLSGV